MRTAVGLIWLLAAAVTLAAAENRLARADYDDVPVRDVIADLRTRSGLKIMVNLDRKERLNRSVTLHLERIPAVEVMRYAAQDAGLGFEVDGEGVVTLTSADVMRTAFFPIRLLDRDVTMVKLHNFFAASGVTFPPGSGIEYHRFNSTLAFTNTAENIRRAALIIGGPLPSGPPRLHLSEAVRIGNLELEPKLDQLYLGPEHHVDLTLNELLAWAHQQTGVNFIALPEVNAYERTLTLSLSRITLRGFLNAVCTAAHLEWHYEDYAIVLTLPVKLLPEPAKADGTDADKRKDGVPSATKKSTSRKNEIGTKMFEDFDKP